MAFELDDRYVWLGLGVSLFFAAKALRYAITDVVRLTQIDPYQYESQKRLQQPEDAISVETLRTLISSPSPSIANAAISIVVSRFAHLPNAYQILSKDAYSTDTQVRARARQAIAYLRDWPSLSGIETPATSPRSPQSLRSIGEIRSTSTSSPDPLEFAEIEAAFADISQRFELPSPANPIAGWTNVPRERPAGGDEREIEARRRRREAMVLHEGEGSVEEADIIRLREE